MVSILDDLKADIDSALTGTLRPATLWSYELVSDGQGGSFPDWTASYPCEGLRGSYDDVLAGLSGIPRTDAKIDLIASTLPIEPKQLDIIIIEGSNWQIVEIAIDPAGAMWTCQCSATSTDPSA